MRKRGLATAIAALAATLGLGGCVVFKVEPKAAQTGPDTVRIKLKICASSPNDGTCPDTGNSSEDADEDETNVVLLGLRAPEGSSAPRKISGNQLEFRRSGQFSRVLNDEAPTPVGFVWTGYRSSPVETDPEDVANVVIDVQIPTSFGGKRFKYRPTVGFFQPHDERPVDSPIVCGEALFDRETGDDGERACIDSPTPDETAKHLSVAID